MVEVSNSRAVMEKIDNRTEFLRRVEQFRFPLTEGYKFDREDANAR